VNVCIYVYEDEEIYYVMNLLRILHSLLTQQWKNVNIFKSIFYHPSFFNNKFTCTVHSSSLDVVTTQIRVSIKENPPSFPFNFDIVLHNCEFH